MILFYTADGIQETTLQAPAGATFRFEPAPVWLADGSYLLLTLEDADARREVWRWPINGDEPRLIGTGILLGRGE